MRKLVTLVGSIVVVACGPSSQGGDSDGGGTSANCSGGQARCVGKAFETCQGGSYVHTETCTNACDFRVGCVECVPNRNYCVGNDVHACSEQGQSAGLVESCSGGLHCGGGECVDLCEEARDNRSYIGCEYFAADLDNAVEVVAVSGIIGCPQGIRSIGNRSVCMSGPTAAGLCNPDGSCPPGFFCQNANACGLDAQGSPFAIVVSNPHGFVVDVTLSNRAGQTSTLTVQPGAVEKLFPQSLGFADQSIDGSGVASLAYRVVSSAPIVAYQFNPLNNEDVFSNDGSLLIPTATYDTRYHTMSWPTLNRRNVPGGPGSPPPVHDYHGYLSIVAWQDNTIIAVTPTADVKAGPTFPAIAKNTPKMFTLNAFDVLTLQADNTQADPEQDLTGTIVESIGDGHTFGVFGAHEATVIRNAANACCADHVEEMLFPSSTWGKEFVIARSQSRGQNEPDILRVLAQAPGTTVTFNPAPIQGNCPTLSEGQFCDVRVMGDLEVSSNNPILIGHMLMSVITGPTSPLDPTPVRGNGDPSLALAVPTEQFRQDYTFLVPNEYDQQFVSIVALANSSVLLNGANVVAQLTPVAGGEYVAGRVAVAPGQHSLDCSQPCGLEVYGYSDAVSYLFAGGLDLKQIVID